MSAASPWIRKTCRCRAQRQAVSCIRKVSCLPESESAKPVEHAIARVAVSLTGKERAYTLLFQIGESL
jgi:hypothetical protein